MSARTADRVMVVGAGIVGLATAFRLACAGHRVTLLDPAPPGSCCSSGNAGVIAPSSIFPFAAPGIARNLRKLTVRPDGPLALEVMQVLRNITWFRRFMAAATPTRFAATTALLSEFMAEVRTDWQSLAADTQTGSFLRQKGYLYVYEAAASWEADRAAWDRRRQAGVAFEELTSRDLAITEPTLGIEVARAIRATEDMHVADLAGLISALLQRLEERGGQIVAGRAERFILRQGRAAAVLVNGEEMAADAFVVATGADGPRLGSQLGCNVPVLGGRGYHLQFGSGTPSTRHPILFVDRKLSGTPMNDGFRLTGYMDFVRAGSEVDDQRLQRLAHHADELIPGLSQASNARWTGMRPMTPDGLPVIGVAPRADNVVLAFGHGQLGVTWAATTARLVTGLVQGRAASVLRGLGPVRR